MQVIVVAGHVGDHVQAVDEPLTSGDVAPLEVLGGHPGELVDRPAVGPLDEGVALDQPARARVGEVARHVLPGEAAPGGPVDVLDLRERGRGDRHGTPAGGEADAEVGEFDQSVAERGPLEVDEADAVGGAQVIAGAGVAVQQRMVRGGVQPLQETGEFIGNRGRYGHVERPGQGEEGLRVGGRGARPDR